MRTATLIAALSALVVLPCRAQTHHERVVHCNGDDPDEAISGCSALIQSLRETSINRSVARYNRGMAEVEKGLYNQAIADYTAAIALNPDYPEAYGNRGIAYGRIGLYDQAIADETRAIALNPTLDKAYGNRAYAYHLRGKDAQGLADAERAVMLAPRDVKNLETRAEIYEKVGRRGDAVADYRALLTLAPNKQSALDGLKRLGVNP